jgi:gliding motility-associated protein GldM
MASGNLSVRQRMINMMYLVLTALLALSVSSEILQAFDSLRNSLAQTASFQGTQNASFSEQIMKTLVDKEKSGITKFAYLKAVVEETNQQSNEMVAYLEGLSKSLAGFAEVDPLTNELVKKDELDKNYRFWLGTDDASNGGRGNGEAAKLHQKMDAFVQWANALLAKHDKDRKETAITPLIVEPKDDPSITDVESQNKPWEYVAFHQKPVVADMALVEKLKMDVRSVQTKLLNVVRGLAEITAFTVDSLIAFEAPSAHVVAAGMKYSTVLGVGIAAKNIKPEFMGSGIALNPGGSTATMTMTANGNVIPDGQYEGIQHYTAMIKVPNAKGEIQNIPVKGQFRVRKPEVVVRMKELQLLYKDCANTIVIDVPSLGDQYNPDFSKSTGGRVIRSAQDKREITVVPNQPKFNLEVASNTNGQVVKLDKLTYQVVQPNKPRITLKVNGNEVNPMNPLNRNMPVTVKLDPDSDFAKSMPRDARYTASKIKLWYKEGMSSAQSIEEVSGANLQRGVEFKLNTQALRSAPPGARVFFEIVGLKRVNFEGKQVEVPGVTLYDVNIAASLR